MSSSSVLLDLLHQPNYIDELEYFATANLESLSGWELEKLAPAIDDAISELTLAIQLDAAVGIEFEEMFLQNITTIVGKLALQMGKTVHKLVAST
ncbi:MAG: hypothetical protein M1288_03940 [Actinobacteria bacterium]|jgi:hypothetical protein|nr:hypothetical protein [Actinomycetota bacterium]